MNLKGHIKYIGFYDCSDSPFKRVGAPSAMHKMQYIIAAFGEVNSKIQLISPSWFSEEATDAPLVFSKKHHYSENCTVVLGPSFGSSSKVFSYLKIIFALTWLFFYLLRNTKKDEKVIMYHSPWLVIPVLLAKKMKRFHLILEVEEIYADVTSLHSYFDKLEYIIFEKADAFLFSTELLAEKLAKNKPYSIIYGNYSVQDLQTQEGMQSDKIKLLYAGIIDSEKAGAFNAIEIAPYLNENYEICILGFGEIEKLQNRIQEINAIASCKVVYDGIRSGSEYVKYCQECSIGLSTQTMSGDYLNTSFPSKILSYLGMGLPVVSCFVDCVSKSSISDLVTYYYEDTPKAIAEAVVNVKKIDKSFQIRRMKELHENFKLDLIKLFQTPQ